MSPQAAELDRDGFTPAEQAYFASHGSVTDGLVEGSDAPSTDSSIVDPAADPVAPLQNVEPAQPDPAADPFDDLEKVATDNKGKTGKVIPEANFRAVSEKYKLTKSERDELRKRVETIEADAKAAREEAAKEREMRTRIDERLKLFNEVIAPQAEAAPVKKVMPNPEEDIFGAFNWLKEQNEELMNKVGQTAQTVHETNAEAQLRSSYESDAANFARKQPDFGAAYNHVQLMRDKMLESIGYTDPKQRASIRLNEEKALVSQALQSGRSPAATMYGVAQSLGYKRAEPQADAAAATAIAIQNPAAPDQPAAPSVTEEIERIAKGQAASRSLSSAGGAPAGAMTVETLANMSEAEFEAYARKNPAIVKQLMGG